MLVHPPVSSLRDGDGSRASGEVALDSDDLVVVLAELETHLGPSIKVRLGRNSSAAALVLADGPVLLKGPSSIDGWLVGTGRLGDLVGRAVSGQGTLVRGLGRWVVGSL